MRHFLISLVALATVVILLRLAPVPIAAQAGGELKTAWGEPDLQGIWTDEYSTPLERRAMYAGREFFTEAERTALDVKRAKPLDHDYRAQRGTENDVAGAYNAIFHLRKRTGPRTSLIVDPPDGRMPPLMPEVLKRQAVWLCGESWRH